jgi:4-amino-4-deoxy-L-arabinose transferase-like glycosyltransferase
LPNPQSSPSLRRKFQPRNWAGPVLVTALALTVFGWDLAAEPHFVDESAYISQSFFADLWLTGDWNNPAWLTYAGYDLPPLPKYVIGFALRAQDYRRPGPSAMVAWYQDTGRQFVSKDALVAARRPSVVLGVLGCLAIYAIGAMARDRRVGLVAALLLIANPLYAMHARRAMSDVYAESLILATAAVGLWSWKRLLGAKPWVAPFLALILGSGVLGGLATLSKLNGALGGFVLGAWAILAVSLNRFPGKRRIQFVLGTCLAGLVAFATFSVLNPFLFAHPRSPLGPGVAEVARLNFLERAKIVSDHRVGVSDQAKMLFPDDALRTVREKVEAVVVQGFGRFGPFGPRGRSDSTIRFDWKQDRGAVLWLPFVTLGLVAAIVRGARQYRLGEPPTAWSVVVQASLASVVVTAFIPLAWDRYFLSIQPGFALLASFTVVEGFDWVRLAQNRKPPAEVLS